MKRCSTTLVSREMQIKTANYTTSHQSKCLKITNVEDVVEKREPSYTVGWNVSWCSHYGKWYGVPKKTKNRITI